MDKFKLFSIVPDSTIEEAFNPTSNLIGQAFRGIAHKVLDPLVRYNIVKDEEMKDFADRTRNKTDAIPNENRDDSKLGLTYKAVEDSSYQLNEEVLREMFSNLIASTVDDRKNGQVKPFFSSILKDMSPTDASLFKLIYKENNLAIASVRIENQNTSEGVNVIKNVILLDDAEIQEPSSLDMLQRFGLIEINPERYLIAQKFVDQYNRFEKSSTYNSVKESIPFQSDDLLLDFVKLLKGNIKLTSLGKDFANIIISQ